MVYLRGCTLLQEVMPRLQMKLSDDKDFAELLAPLESFQELRESPTNLRAAVKKDIVLTLTCNKVIWRLAKTRKDTLCSD